MFRTLITAVAGILVSASLCMAAPITFKLGHIAEPENPYGMGADYFAKLVKERSNGQIEIQVFPSSQLGSKTDLVDQMQMGEGVIHIGDGSFWADYGAPEMSIVSAPALYKTENE